MEEKIKRLIEILSEAKEIITEAKDIITEVEEYVKIKADRRHEIHISQINISSTTRNKLENAGIKCVGDIIKYGRRNLLRIRYFGKKNLDSVEKAINELGLVLR